MMDVSKVSALGNAENILKVPIQMEFSTLMHPNTYDGFFCWKLLALVA